MIQVLSNILYYLNLAALLHYHQDSINNSSNVSVISNGHSVLVHSGEDNLTVPSLPPVLVKQIPPGPILPGIVVKFVCAVNGSSICGTDDETSDNDEKSYQWEIYRYTADQDGHPNSTSVVKLPGQEAEMEIKFNETVADPKTHCDLVCTINKNQPSAPPSKASIKLNFLKTDNHHVATVTPLPPSNFKMLDITSRAAYFAWHPPRYRRTNEYENGETYPQITGYVIEYKNGRGATDWRSDKVSRYIIKDGNTVAACISGLNPWTTYHFRIISVSKNVSSTPSLPIIVRTSEEVPSASPTEVKVEVISENTLEVSWTPPPRSSWNGALLGYNIGLKKASSDEHDQYEIYMLNPRETLGSLYSYRVNVPDPTILYKVVVQAFNNIGSGPFSEPVTQRPRHTETTVI